MPPPSLRLPPALGPSIETFAVSKAKVTSQAIFIEAKTRFQAELSLLSSENTRCKHELDDVQRWLAEIRRVAKGEHAAEARDSIEADLRDLHLYEAELKQQIHQIEERLDAAIAALAAPARLSGSLTSRFGCAGQANSFR